MPKEHYKKVLVSNWEFDRGKFNIVLHGLVGAKINSRFVVSKRLTTSGLLIVSVVAIPKTVPSWS